VVCDGKNVTGINDEIEFAPGNHDCSASKNGFGSKSLTFSATPGQTTEVLFDLPPLPAATQAKAAAAAGTPAPTTPAPKPAPVAAAKPASPTPAAKPAPPKPATTPPKPALKPKKKCSTFLGCK
jgi:outer membrane biosynthesis protein TonB